MQPIPPDLAGHPDRLKWNARYSGSQPSFAPHPVAEAALALPAPDGPVLELACGPSGSALLAAATGRPVTAVDASDVALGMLADEAQRRGLGTLITPVLADLGSWRPRAAGFSLVLCTNYWDRAVFARAVTAVRAGGVLAWQALTEAARIGHPQLPPEWCLGPGEPASLLPPGFAVLSQDDEGPQPATRRRLLASRSDQPTG
ncbi:MAG TPA: class I SAM-dependent methyltransferase [Streptosporangiaceae bacterium]|nr:class I SAM-dependent methyltransferase [Streptosporangiaceae bacterium]